MGPEWRTAWQGLDPEQQERIRSAFRTATPLNDPGLEAIVQGYVARAERRLRWLPAQAIVTACIILLWMYLTLIVRPSPFGVFWAAALVVEVVWGTVAYRRLARELTTARRNGL
jgi:hypothetical protein